MNAYLGLICLSASVAWFAFFQWVSHRPHRLREGTFHLMVIGLLGAGILCGCAAGFTLRKVVGKSSWIEPNTGIDIAKYIGKPASDLLRDIPFKDWSVEKSFENDLEAPRINYIFVRHGLEMICDGKDVIQTIFLDPTEFPENKVLCDTSRFRNRQQVLERFGKSSKSGEKSISPILGYSGPWDRFRLEEYTIHFENGVDSDQVVRITFMRNDVVP